MQDRRRVRGDASRRAVLESATDLASTDGLDGLTIGRLAETSGLSKSSIATLFGGKEGLQLATVEAARQVFRESVVDPARGEDRGIRRLAALLRSALDYSRERVFSGGCFFAATAADVDSKPGPVRDAVRGGPARLVRLPRGAAAARGREGRDPADAATGRAARLRGHRPRQRGERPLADDGRDAVRPRRGRDARPPDRVRR